MVVVVVVVETDASRSSWCWKGAALRVDYHLVFYPSEAWPRCIDSVVVATGASQFELVLFIRNRDNSAC